MMMMFSFPIFFRLRWADRDSIFCLLVFSTTSQTAAHPTSPAQYYEVFNLEYSCACFAWLLLIESPGTHLQLNATY